MEEIKSQVTTEEPDKIDRTGIIIGIAALVLFVLPMFGCYWYFINQAITHWAPMHNALMAKEGYGVSWGMGFSLISWKVMAWLSPLIVTTLVTATFILRQPKKWKQFSEQQRNNIGLAFSIGWQILIVYYIAVSIGLIMGWGELVVSLPLR